MALQNIGALNKDDAFYRYKMPSMITKIEGRGSGIRTKIENIAHIAKALDRPALYITKYFGYELGATNKLDEQHTSFVSGAHDTAKLAGLLDNFIKKYVQCYECGNPETKIDISKNAEEHKGGNAMKNEGKAANENQKKLKKDKKNKGVCSKESTANKAAIGGSDKDHSTPPSCCQDGGNVCAADEDGDDDDVQWQADTSLEAVEQRMQEQLTTVTAELVTLSTDESEKKKESSHNDAAVYGSSNHLDNSDDKQIVGKALSDGVGKGFTEEVVKNMDYLAAAVPDNGSQTLLLLAIEVFSRKCSALALKEIPFVLRALYYGDVLDEETILRWYNVAAANGKNSQVLQYAKPFVECLQNSDYESEEQ
ncbi:hypothetical protein HU200_053448 [Digitaria exilis]|uniref:W2 domain-containing protein n=1 Tax=Digitaria exilis TaxID=1010633 RepID=A0A835E4U6_9POAL|nr:hypothetical protein HU200_053448 [Digitaria exilis]